MRSDGSSSHRPVGSMLASDSAQNQPRKDSPIALLMRREEEKKAQSLSNSLTTSLKHQSRKRPPPQTNYVLSKFSKHIRTKTENTNLSILLEEDEDKYNLPKKNKTFNTSASIKNLKVKPMKKDCRKSTKYTQFLKNSLRNRNSEERSTKRGYLKSTSSSRLRVRQPAR